jgi:hypothetical protein
LKLDRNSRILPNALDINSTALAKEIVV